MKIKTLTRTALCMAVPSVAVLPMVVSCKQAAENEKPNVIFILLDDAGYGDFSCYGQTKTETPNIDALAAEGIRFTDMYSNAPVSAPSRGCLMTGLHMGHAQIRDNVEEKTDPSLKGLNIWDYEEVDRCPELEGQMPLKAGTPTLATAMKSAGYATGMVGKWGLGGPTTEGAPWKMGFDFFYGTICQRVAHNYYPAYYWKNGEKEYINTLDKVVYPGTKLDEGADPLDVKSYAKYSEDKVYGPDRLFDNVLGFVRENKDKPFFLMWTSPVPHSPLQAPQEWVDKYVEKLGDEAPLVGENCRQREWPHNYYPCRYPHATYAAMIGYLDYQIGELVVELKKQGVYENTVIIITSDNGPANNASSPTVWFDSAQPFRCGRGWGKRSLKEGGIRMPFIASYPAKLKEGKVSDHIGCFADVMPTICELAGVESPVTDGVSIAPLLTGNDDVQQQHEYLYWEFKPRGGQVAVRWGNWKGIIENVLEGNRTMQLFDLSQPGKDVELPEKDVAAQHPEIVERMWNYIEEAHTPSDVPAFYMDISRK